MTPYLGEGQVRTAGRRRPKGCSRELPSPAEGAPAKLLRVYDVALRTIARRDGRIDPNRTATGRGSLSIEQSVSLGSQQHAAGQVSKSNGTGTRRCLKTMDRHVFVEAMSPVKQTERADSNADYAAMDFAAATAARRRSTIVTGKRSTISTSCKLPPPTAVSATRCG